MKVGIVTGGSQGFGAALVKRLLEMNQDWHVAILDIKKVVPSSEKVLSLSCDVSDHNQVR